MANKETKTEVMDSVAAEAPAAEATPSAQAPVAAATPAAGSKTDFTKFNTLSIVSIATAISWVGADAGVITGHIALAQIKRSGEKGRGLAITGLVLGYLYIAGSIAMGALMLLFRVRGWVGGGSYGYGNHFGGGMMGGFNNDGDNNGWGMMGR